MRPRSGRQPEVKRRIDEIDHLGIVEVSATVVHKGLAGRELLFLSVGLFVIFFCKLKYLLLKFFLFAHIMFLF